jgi:DNA modification methylase
VLEPFAGSGSVPVAAIRCGRLFVAVDIDKFYVDMTLERVEKEMKRPPQYGSKPVIAAKSEGPQFLAKKLFTKEVFDD